MGGAVGDFAEVGSYATHDELGCFGGEAGIAPPAQAALDVGIHFFGLGAVVLGEHPGTEKAGLKAVAGIVFDERPGGDVNGETGVVGFGNFICGD